MLRGRPKEDSLPKRFDRYASYEGGFHFRWAGVVSDEMGTGMNSVAHRANALDPENLSRNSALLTFYGAHAFDDKGPFFSRTDKDLNKIDVFQIKFLCFLPPRVTQFQSNEANLAGH